MYDAGAAIHVASLPRARGTGRIAVRAIKGRTRLADLGQQGSARILRPHGQGPGFEATLLNTAGGITGGDRFSWEAEAGPGTRLTLATQAAERGYRSSGGHGAVTTRLSLGAGARIDWLPQETILFDGAALHRRLEVEMAEDATLLAVEPVLLGRSAMGETVQRADFRDRWEIRRAGRLIHLEALRLDGPIGSLSQGSATLAGHRAFATILYLAPDAEAWLDAVRAGLPETAGASAWEGRLVVRLLADGSLALRRALVPILETLRGAALPRVWTI